MTSLQKPFRNPALLLLACALSHWGLEGATRPRYGGVLRVQIQDTYDSADAPEAQRRLGALAPAFKLQTWEPRVRAVYVADEDAPGGRPYLDSIEVEMGRPVRQQAIDLGLGRADVTELGREELRRQAPERVVWSSAPVRVIAIVFHSRVADARIREALALAVDRAAMHNVLLQKQGEISGALVPQWLSGYAFLFPTTADLTRARALVSELPASSRRLRIAAADPALQPVAERIAVNARDAGLTVSPAPGGSAADATLMAVRIPSADPAHALAIVAAAMGLSEPPPAASAEALYAAERALLEGFRAIPLFHLPDVYAAGARVKGGPGITPAGQWRFENLWLEGPARP